MLIHKTFFGNFECKKFGKLNVCNICCLFPEFNKPKREK